MNIKQITERRELTKLIRTHISHYNKMFSSRQKRIADILLQQSPNFYTLNFPSLIKEPQNQFYLKRGKKFPRPTPFSKI